MTKPKRIIQYKARDGSPITNAQADVIGREVEHMRSEGVDVTPARVVERAKSTDSPLHSMFNWDDKSAAEAYRLDWARKLLGSIVTIDIKTKQPAKAFYSITVEKADDKVGREYVPRRTIMDNESAMGQVSVQLYGVIAGAVKNAKQLGLGDLDPNWSRIISAVEMGRPQAMLEGMAEAG